MKSIEVNTTIEDRCYCSLRVPRVSVWACFETVDDYGNRGLYKSRVIFWGLSDQGVPVGFVIGTESRRLQEAERFSNFVGYEYPRGAEQRLQLATVTYR